MTRPQGRTVEPRAAVGRGLPFLVLLLLGVSGILALLREKEIRSGAFLVGDCPYYASSAVSLWIDGDLDLRNQLRGGLEAHHRQVALGRGGEWYPKHPILMPVLSVPFYALLGPAGFLVFNVLVFLLLGTAMWLLCRRHTPPGIAAAATLLVLGATFLRAYVYNYSPDLFSTLLVLSAILALLERRSWAGGLLLGLSVMAKLTNLFTAAIVGVFLVARRPRREALRVALGVVPALAALALLNTALFGGPMTSGYDRTLVLQDGTPTLVSHRGFFDLPVGEGVLGQLFSKRVGLLTTSPVLLLSIPGFVLLFRRDPWEGLLLLCVAEFIFLLFSTYRFWDTSHYGNRFLMTPVCLAVVPLAFALERIRVSIPRIPFSHRLSPAGSRER